MAASEGTGSGTGPGKRSAAEGANRLLDNIQKAIDDLRGAGDKATGDVRTSIDSAVERLRGASANVSLSDQVAQWRTALDGATEEVRRELGRLAVRAQSSMDSIEELAKELDARRKDLLK